MTELSSFELSRRLTVAGLPRPTVQATPPREVADNDAAALEYFGRQRSVAERQRLHEQFEQATPAALLQEWAERSALARRRFAQLQPIREAREQAKRQLERDRVRAWSADHTERKRAHRDAYRQRHPEQAKVSDHRYYQRKRRKVATTHAAYRDDHQEQRSEDARTWRAEHRQRRAQLQRSYRADPEKYARILQQNRDRRRLVNHLKAAGLPPRKAPVVPAAQRRKDLAAADRFFTRKRTAEERHRIKNEYEPTPPELLERWARFSALARRRSAVMEQVSSYLERHDSRLREEVVLDSRARRAQGLPPLDIDTEVAARARKYLSDAAAHRKVTRRRPTTIEAAVTAEKNVRSGTDERSVGEPPVKARSTRTPLGSNTGPHLTPDAGQHRGPGLS